MHWKNKFYCVLFCQMFNVIVQMYKLQQTYEWWTHMRHTFICSHWILFYLNEKAFWSCDFEWFWIWKSSYTNVNNFYKQSTSNQCSVLNSNKIKKLSVTNWIANVTTSSLNISLFVILINLNDWLTADVRNIELITNNKLLISLFVIDMHTKCLSQYIKFKDHSCWILQTNDDIMRS